jgi:hypothetical protein
MNTERRNSTVGIAAFPMEMRPDQPPRAQREGTRGLSHDQKRHHMRSHQESNRTGLDRTDRPTLLDKHGTADFVQRRIQKFDKRISFGYKPRKQRGISQTDKRHKILFGERRKWEKRNCINAEDYTPILQCVGDGLPQEFDANSDLRPSQAIASAVRSCEGNNHFSGREMTVWTAFQERARSQKHPRPGGKGREDRRQFERAQRL